MNQNNQRMVVNDQINTIFSMSINRENIAMRADVLKEGRLAFIKRASPELLRQLGYQSKDEAYKALSVLD